MTISHFVVKYGSRAKGDSSVTNYQNLVNSEKDELEHLEHKNYPLWAKDNPLEFWQASDKYEPANEKIYVQIESPLPRELSQEERLLLVKNFLEQKLSRHPYTLVIRNSIALNREENPHLLVLFSERIIDEVKRSKKQFFTPANSKLPERGGAAKNHYWTHLPNIATLHDSWKQAVRMALEESDQKKLVDLTNISKQKVKYSTQPKGAVQEIAASTLYQLVGKRKHALYEKLGELKEKRYQMGVRWTTNGFVFPTPLTAPKAYEKALKILGGLKYLEAKNRLQQAERYLTYTKQKHPQSSPKISREPRLALNVGLFSSSSTLTKYHEAIEQYQTAQKAFDELKFSLEREPKRLQSLMNKLLWEDQNKHLFLQELETEINVLHNAVNTAKQFQAELALLGEIKIVIRPKVNLLDVTRLIVNRSSYEAKLRSAWSYNYLQSLSWKHYQLH